MRVRVVHGLRVARFAWLSDVCRVWPAAGIRTVSKAIKSKGGASAVSLRVAEQYVEAFGKIAKKGNTVLLPANTGDPAAMVAQAMSVYRAVQGSSVRTAATAATAVAAVAVGAPPSHFGQWRCRGHWVRLWMTITMTTTAATTTMEMTSQTCTTTPMTPRRGLRTSPLPLSPSTR